MGRSILDLTEDVSPDLANSYVPVSNASLNVTKRVKLTALGGGGGSIWGNAGGTVSASSAAAATSVAFKVDTSVARTSGALMDCFDNGAVRASIKGSGLLVVGASTALSNSGYDKNASFIGVRLAAEGYTYNASRLQFDLSGAYSDAYLDGTVSKHETGFGNSRLKSEAVSGAVYSRWMVGNTTRVIIDPKGALNSVVARFDSAAVGNDLLQLRELGNDRLLVTSDGALSVAETLQSGAPASGTATALPFKIGSNVPTAGLTLKTSEYVELEIGGVLLKLALVN